MASASSRSGANWLLLILTLPGRQAALRMRSWRGLQAVGAGVLRGMRARIRDDQQLFTATAQVFDDPYSAFGNRS